MGWLSPRDLARRESLRSISWGRIFFLRPKKVGGLFSQRNDPKTQTFPITARGSSEFLGTLWRKNSLLKVG